MSDFRTLSADFSVAPQISIEDVAEAKAAGFAMLMSLLTLAAIALVIPAAYSGVVSERAPSGLQGEGLAVGLIEQFTQRHLEQAFLIKHWRLRIRTSSLRLRKSLIPPAQKH